MSVRDLIGDPFYGYTHFDMDDQPEDLQGWGGHKEFLGKMIEISRPTRIIEVGSWKGKSAIAMAEACLHLHRFETQESRRSPYQLGEIVCVDTWLGATEFVGRPNDDPKRGLRKDFGYPSIYYQFMANVFRARQHDMITPFPQTSVNAARFLKKYNIKADLIYIDGSHEYDDVKQDLEMYYELLNENGLIFGDDYCEYWGGVIKAVNEFAGKNSLYLQTRRYKNEQGDAPSDYWVLSKNGLDL